MPVKPTPSMIILKEGSATIPLSATHKLRSCSGLATFRAHARSGYQECQSDARYAKDQKNGPPTESLGDQCTAKQPNQNTDIGRGSEDALRKRPSLGRKVIGEQGLRGGVPPASPIPTPTLRRARMPKSGGSGTKCSDRAPGRHRDRQYFGSRPTIG